MAGEVHGGRVEGRWREIRCTSPTASHLLPPLPPSKHTINDTYERERERERERLQTRTTALGISKCYPLESGLSKISKPHGDFWQAH